MESAEMKFLWHCLDIKNWTSKEYSNKGNTAVWICSWRHISLWGKLEKRRM